MALEKKALLVVDVQNDFLPGGALPVGEGDRVIPVINELLKQDFDLKVASKDWHPLDHGSFAIVHGKSVGEKVKLSGLDQILWPEHCVQKTPGAEFPSSLNTPLIDQTIHKGSDPQIDSYSAFFDNGRKKSTNLHELLQKKKITHLYVVGLATDYCVKFSVLDALSLGYKVYVVEDACRGVNLNKEDSANALKEMHRAGAQLIQSKDVL